MSFVERHGLWAPAQSEAMTAVKDAVAAGKLETIRLSFADQHGVLINPLLYDGYPSIGCAPCTARVKPGDDPRSGRWAGLSKTECGLHE